MTPYQCASRSVVTGNLSVHNDIRIMVRGMIIFSEAVDSNRDAQRISGRLCLLFAITISHRQAQTHTLPAGAVHFTVD